MAQTSEPREVYSTAKKSGILGSLEEIVEDVEADDHNAKFMENINRSVPLVNYHNTLSVTFILIMKSKHLRTSLQIETDKSNAKMMNELINLESKLRSLY